MNPTKFTATTAWRKSIEILPDNARLEVYDAIFKYAEDGIAPEHLSDMARVAFSFIRTDIDTLAEQRRKVSDCRRLACESRWNKVKGNNNIE